MVRKIGSLIAVLGLIGAILCAPVQAATHSIYENGSLGTTYITYFKDILSGCSFKDNYVAFRSGQNEYTMVVGELEYSNNTFTLKGQGKEYVFYTEGTSYSSQYQYRFEDINNFSLNYNNAILYSDIENFPQLIERGAKFEILSVILLLIIMCSFVIRRIFFKR